MYEKYFTSWHKWDKRNKIKNLKYPGVYIIAISEKDMHGIDFYWSNKIIYVGMTNSKKGLKGRLYQFDNTILGKQGHGGAQRVRYKYQNYEALEKNLFVSVAPFICDMTSDSPSDLRKMGEVAKFEYDCIAQFVEIYNNLPEFNDKKRSPKIETAYKYRERIHSNAEDFDSYGPLISLLLKRGQGEEALKYAEQWKKLDVNRPYGMVALGIIYTEIDETSRRGIETLQKAMDDYPIFPSAYRAFSKSLVKRGSSEDARKKLREINEFFDFDWQDVKLYLLATETLWQTVEKDFICERVRNLVNKARNEHGLFPFDTFASIIWITAVRSSAFEEMRIFVKSLHTKDFGEELEEKFIEIREKLSKAEGKREGVIAVTDITVELTEMLEEAPLTAAQYLKIMKKVRDSVAENLSDLGEATKEKIVHKLIDLVRQSKKRSLDIGWPSTEFDWHSISIEKPDALPDSTKKRIALAFALEKLTEYDESRSLAVFTHITAFELLFKDKLLERPEEKLYFIDIGHLLKVYCGKKHKEAKKDDAEKHKRYNTIKKYVDLLEKHSEKLDYRLSEKSYYPVLFGLNDKRNEGAHPDSAKNVSEKDLEEVKKELYIEYSEGSSIGLIQPVINSI